MNHIQPSIGILQSDLISAEKVMMTIIWVFIVDMLPEGELTQYHYTRGYFVTHIIKPLGVKKDNIWSECIRYLIMLHIDNARVHNSIDTSYEIKKNKFKRAPRPPYSTDLAPSDFFLFKYVVEKLIGKEMKFMKALLKF